MKIKYFMSHGSPWTFLGHKKVNEISKKNNCDLDIMPVNYGEIFPVSGGFPVHKRPCLLYTSPSPRDVEESRMPSSA